MNLQQGTLLQGGKYRIECELGHGGFGITYLAVQLGLNRRVAIKEFFMSEYCNRDVDTSHVSVPSEGSKELVAKFRNKFIKEAQNIAGLKHPNIISIYDVFEDNGTAYYVMEYLDRGSMADVVKHQGRLSEAEALHYIRQIADALRYIHERKMNHLDVKPANILIDENNAAVLIDFGLSKRYDDEGNQTSTTPVGISHGYAPLEQYKKSGVGTFSPATDIYSLGATLYKLITGITPPDANDILTDGLPSHPGIMSAPVYAAIEQAMQPNKNKRPQTIDEFLILLDVSISADDEKTELIVEKLKVVVDNENEYREAKRCSSLFKKSLLPLLVCVVAVVAFLGVRARSYNRAEEARLAAIEQHRLDSIKAEEDKRIAEEKRKEEERQSFLPTGAISGHEYVDLGLSVKWATCNVGALSPSDYGGYYAWGETGTKSHYTEETYKYNRKNIGENISGTQYDVALVNWGNTWRLPTKAEFQELIDQCTWTWISLGGHKGYRVTGVNGNSIFLPSAGRLLDTSLGVIDNGFYWSAMPEGEISAFVLYFDDGTRYMDWYSRYGGRTIRPVSD